MTTLESGIVIPVECDFTLANLPFGIASHECWQDPHTVVAIGDHVVDCVALSASGTFEGLRFSSDVFTSGTLNQLFATGRHVVTAVRERVQALLSATGQGSGRHAASPSGALVHQDAVTMHLPFSIGDYVDFYSSEAHATNLGMIFRPGGDPLLPNWKQIPVGYHGRAGTIVPSGTDIVRPQGIITAEGSVGYRPTQMLDIELEVGTFLGVESPLGSSVTTEDAADHVAGFVLFNDWSARDIQSFEYQPLGPNLGKSFASSVSPWVVTLDALAPFLVRQPIQDPSPVEHLKPHGAQAINLHLEVSMTSPRMREGGHSPAVICRTNFSDMYWTWAQQIAHMTSGGASIRPGDFIGSGTVSGRELGSRGSLIESTWRGQTPIDLPSGEHRSFLEDGDEITIRGWCGARSSRVGFGSVTGRIVPATCN